MGSSGSIRQNSVWRWGRNDACFHSERTAPQNGTNETVRQKHNAVPVGRLFSGWSLCYVGRLSGFGVQWHRCRASIRLVPPMDVSAHSLSMLGPTEIFYSFDTYQFSDYNRYDATMIDARHKEEMRDTQFPKDLERAYELGKRLVNAAK